MLKEAHEVGFGGFLQRKDSSALEAEVRLEVLGDLADETLEWELSDEELGGLLVSADLTESHGTWTVTMWLLDSTCERERVDFSEISFEVLTANHCGRGFHGKKNLWMMI